MRVLNLPKQRSDPRQLLDSEVTDLSSSINKLFPPRHTPFILWRLMIRSVPISPDPRSGHPGSHQSIRYLSSLLLYPEQDHLAPATPLDLNSMAASLLEISASEPADTICCVLQQINTAVLPPLKGNDFPLFSFSSSFTFSLPTSPLIFSQLRLRQPNAILPLFYLPSVDSQLVAYKL